MQRRKAILVAVILSLTICIATALLIYQNTRAPFRKTVLEVDDTSVKMRYFLKRLYLAQTTTKTMLQRLTEEEIIKRVAPKPPYNVKISDEEIDHLLKQAHNQQTATKGDHSFSDWYRQKLEQTGLSPAEYRELVRTNLLSQQLIHYLEDKVPTVAEQVHLYMIAQGSLAEAQHAKRRLEAGEDFYALARELNVDEELKAQGGDLGWYPRGSLADNLAHAAFDQLDIGQPSVPLVVSDQLVVIIMVAERVSARQIDKDKLQRIRSGVFEEWMKQEYRHHTVVVHGLKNGYEAETEAWVQWQLQKMRKE
jgi:foldase protein PrsA